MWYLGDFPNVVEKVAALALNLYTVEEGRSNIDLTTFSRKSIGRLTPKKSGFKNDDVSSLRYSGDFPSLMEKVATLALNLYTVGEGRSNIDLTTFFVKK